MYGNRNRPRFPLDVVGAALAFPAAGYGYPAQVAFGEASPEQQMALACGGAPFSLDPNFVAAMTAQRHAVLMGAQCAPQEVETYLGFESKDPIAPGETISFKATPQYPSKLVGLIIPSSIASQLAVTDLKIGVKSQFGGEGLLPGLLFQEATTSRRMNGDTAQSQQPIVLSIRNISDADVTFIGGVMLVGVQGYGPQIFGGPQG